MTTPSSLRRYTRPDSARTTSVPSSPRSKSSHSSDPGMRTPAQRPSSSRAYSTVLETEADFATHTLHSARNRRHHRLQGLQHGLQHVGRLVADALELRLQLVRQPAQVEL